jgi:hypothetical protein
MSLRACDLAADREKQREREMVRSSPRASLASTVSKCGRRQMCEGSGDFLLTMRRSGSHVLTGRGPIGGGGPHGAHRGRSWAVWQRKWSVDELQW